MTGPDRKPCELPGCTNHLHRGVLAHSVFAKRRFCSPECSYKGQRRGMRKPATVCKAGLHDLTDPANVYVTPSNGRRRCLPCLRARDAARYTSTPGPTPRRPARPRPTPAPAPTLQQRPTWRPAAPTTTTPISPLRGRTGHGNDFAAMRHQLGHIHTPEADTRKATRAVTLRYERGQLTATETRDILEALGLITPNAETEAAHRQLAAGDTN